ncbi:hypothetical protein Sango_1825400 [Sesamum angolense]|uniref:Uncharacterized protein n=1 Tax=Sesamum angolense TaxID=2727404 RepID=A0AAE2BQ06_9LAMI|nr:hypothetical protein Sango_1825400 [Sesamum angolense]
MASKLSPLSSTLLTLRTESPPDSSKLPAVFPFPVFLASQNFHTPTPTKSRRTTGVLASSVSAAEAEVEVADGYTITRFCDKMIDVFLNEKPKSKDWKRYLIFREEWGKYRERFYNRCKVRADAENDSQMKQKLIDLSRKVRKIDDEMENHAELLKEIQDNPMDINAIVAKRRGTLQGISFAISLCFRKPMTAWRTEMVVTLYFCLRTSRGVSSFRRIIVPHIFGRLLRVRHGLTMDGAVDRLGARCLAAVSAFDNTLEIVGTLDTAQAKFDDILNSPSLDVACEKIKSLAKAKELDSSLILLINGAWASAKESTTMRNEVKEIMYRLYKATQSSLRSIAPKEIKLLKYLLNITDPEERFSALASAFSPGDEHDELHKWIKIMLDAYHLNKEETEMREARKMNQPVVIQRLFILKETIEEEYLERNTNTSTAVNSEDS